MFSSTFYTEAKQIVFSYTAECESEIFKNRFYILVLIFICTYTVYIAVRVINSLKNMKYYFDSVTNYIYSD
jgi:hypothetical protein